MRLVVLGTVAVIGSSACKTRKDCDAYLDELKAWGDRVDDRLASQHVTVPNDTPSAPAAALDPVTPHSTVYEITKTELVFAGIDLESGADRSRWDPVFESLRMAEPVAIAVAPDAPWWRVVVGVGLLEDIGFTASPFVFLADPIPEPPRADRAKFALPDDGRRVERYAEWSNRVIDRCPSFGSLMWPQRGHDATPREMAIAAKDCSCEVDPVEISSWFAYDLLPTTMGVAKAQASVLFRSRLKVRPDDITTYLETLRGDLTVDATGSGLLAAPADTPWREMAPRLVGATGPIKLRILRH